MHFLDEKTGFIVGKSLFVKTTDGGDTFTTVMSGDFNDIGFSNATNGLVVPSGRRCYQTTDGGNTWQEGNFTTYATSNRIYFAESKVYTSARTYISSGDRLINLDSREFMTIPKGAQKLLFLNPNNCIAIGQQYEAQGFFPYGYIYLTNNGWASSQQKKYQPSSEAYDFQAIAKISSRKTMIIGSGQLANLVVLVKY